MILLRDPNNSHRRSRRKPKTSLRFTPYAWAKLLFLREAGPTEVGAFGLSTADDLLLVRDLRLVRQSCTRISVRFEDAAVADFFGESVDAGLTPEQFARVWIHTHPGESAEPTTTDERTFLRVFGGCDWAVMVILADGGESYARLRFSAGPSGDLVLPVEVDFTAPFAAADTGEWGEEYNRNVSPLPRSSVNANSRRRRPRRGLSGAADEIDVSAEASALDSMFDEVTHPELSIEDYDIDLFH